MVGPAKLAVRNVDLRSLKSVFVAVSLLGPRLPPTPSLWLIVAPFHPPGTGKIHPGPNTFHRPVEPAIHDFAAAVRWSHRSAHHGLRERWRPRPRERETWTPPEITNVSSSGDSLTTITLPPGYPRMPSNQSIPRRKRDLWRDGPSEAPKVPIFPTKVAPRPRARGVTRSPEAGGRPGPVADLVTLPSPRVPTPTDPRHTGALLS